MSPELSFGGEIQYSGPKVTVDHIRIVLSPEGYRR
jgi:hypothetical protein